MSTVTANLTDGYAVDLRSSSGHRWAADEQRHRLAEVAASCPVHKTLAKGVHLIDQVTFA